MVILFWNGALQLYIGAHFLSTLKMLAGSEDISILTPLPTHRYIQAFLASAEVTKCTQRVSDVGQCKGRQW